MTEANVVLTGVTEYGEGYPVELVTHEGRVCVRARNEGGNNDVVIDFAELAAWIEANGAEATWHEVT